MGLSSSDQEAPILRFLARNPELSLAASRGERLVGTILVGHDGRRGFIHHLAVSPSERRNGLGRRLVELALSRLAREGVERCHALVHQDNLSAESFWTAIGAEKRDDLVLYSVDLEQPDGQLARD